jgi:hypothetical protein
MGTGAFAPLIQALRSWKQEDIEFEIKKKLKKKKKSKTSWVPVAHAYNPSYLGG